MLTEGDLPLWDDLNRRSPQRSVFCSSWWLRASCGSPQVLGLFERGRLVAGMPLYFERKFGIKICRMPKLTPVWGVVIEPFMQSGTNAAAREFDIARQFAGYVSTIRIFEQKFHPAQQNWLPFYWNGLVQTSRITYVIENPRDCDQMWMNLSQSTRSAIRKAKGLGLTVLTGTVDDVWEMVKATFQLHGKAVGYTREYLDRLNRAAVERNQGANLAVRDKAGNLMAAAFMVWDSERAYGLVSGANAKGRNLGASSLLEWEMIKASAQFARVFDLEGSMLEGVERFYRNFGGKRIAYNWVMSFPVWLYMHLKKR